VIDMRQLAMFRQVIDAGSFSAAARALHCSQPAVSQQMKALERSIGGSLFIRVGRGLQLTDAGCALARYATDILNDVAVAHQQVRAIASHELGSVRVCAFPSANATLVPRAAAALKERHPSIRIELLEDEPPASFDVLRRADCDVVVAFNYAHEPGAVSAPDAGMLRVPLMTDPLVLLVPASSEIARRPEAALADLADQDWIAGCPRCRQHFVRVCADSGFTPSIVCATDDNLALQSLVSSGLGVALVPRLVLSFLSHPDVVAVPVEPARSRRIAAYTWHDLARVSAIEATLAALQTAAASMEVSQP
jgi:DNA-binding transcriptional LysR family regulator